MATTGKKKISKNKRIKNTQSKLSPIRNAAVLTVGDELLIGQVVNTNSAHLGSILTNLGYHITESTSVGDHKATIEKTIKRLIQNNDVILVSGGLGPTSDDITVETIAKTLKLPLKEDKEWLKKMEEFFKARGRIMTANNKKQALLPKTAKRINNNCGTAPGVHITHSKSDIFLMPGVPYEMKAMMEEYITPWLQKKNSSQYIYHKTIHTAGVGESILAERLGDVSHFMKEDVTLAYLPALGEVRLRVSVMASNEKAALLKAKPFEAHILKTLQKNIYGEEGITLEAAVGNLLKEKNLTIAVAESCTGGLVNHKLTNVSGSSRYLNGGLVAYANEVKSKELQVPENLFKTKGAVSEEVAKAMAIGVAKKFNAGIGVGVTGIAGPDGGTAEKPVGTVYVSVFYQSKSHVRKFVFEKDRLRNKERFASATLNMVRLVLLGEEIS